MHFYWLFLPCNMLTVVVSQSSLRKCRPPTPCLDQTPTDSNLEYLPCNSLVAPTTRKPSKALVFMVPGHPTAQGYASIGAVMEDGPLWVVSGIVIHIFGNSPLWLYRGFQEVAVMRKQLVQPAVITPGPACTDRLGYACVNSR